MPAEPGRWALAALATALAAVIRFLNGYATGLLAFFDPEGGGRLIPRASDAALACRLRDRFFDLYVDVPMQKVVGDKLVIKGGYCDGQLLDPAGVQVLVPGW